MKIVPLILITLFVVTTTNALANPTQTGETGLITVPTADTLDAGNICLGVWSNFAKNGTAPGDPAAVRRDAFILPVAMTLGLGSFWEVYGTYPNVLFNRQEPNSGRGTANVGTKLRFWGKRSSRLKLAIDFFASRHITQDATNGNLDIGGRLITSLRNDRMGVHIYGGYKVPKGTSTTSFDDEILYGGGYEFSPTSRTKLTVELVGNTNRIKSLKNQLEATLGFQYYISPHLTINVAGSYGITSGSPDWRTIIGLTSCQGVGSYLRPVQSTFTSMDERDDKKAKQVKPVKITPISPLLLRSPSPTVPTSKLEIPVEGDSEEVVIKPYGQVVIQQQAALKTGSSAVITRYAAPPDAKKSSEAPQETTPGQKQEVRVEKSDETVVMKQNGKPGVQEESSRVITDDSVQGVTPLYTVDIKDQKVELARSTSARLPEVMKVYRKFRFPDVSFDFDQWSLSAEGKKQLSEVADLIRNDKKWVYIRIDGHTDSIGSINYNMDLSLKRSISVAAYLINREGIDPSRLFLKGMGKSKQIADNATSEGRRQNRRCEVLLLIPKDTP